MSQQSDESGAAHATSQPGRQDVLQNRKEESEVQSLLSRVAGKRLSVPSLPINAPLKRACSWQAPPARKSIKAIADRLGRNKPGAGGWGGGVGVGGDNAFKTSQGKIINISGSGRCGGSLYGWRGQSGLCELAGEPGI